MCAVLDAFPKCQITYILRHPPITIMHCLNDDIEVFFHITRILEKNEEIITEHLLDVKDEVLSYRNDSFAVRVSIPCLFMDFQ
jgi:predicted secreted Zn-dependent protease